MSMQLPESLERQTAGHADQAHERAWEATVDIVFYGPTMKQSSLLQLAEAATA
jgi:hypothetical protein